MRYVARVAREGRAWTGEVEGLQGAHTWANSLAGLRKGLQEVVILAADLPDEATPEVELVFEGLAAEAAHTAEEKSEAEAGLSLALMRVADTARTLVRKGYSVRDAAEILGVSPGRISQITKA